MPSHPEFSSSDAPDDTEAKYPHKKETDSKKTSKKSSFSSKRIVQFNRRLTPPSKIQIALNKEFQDAQKHLNECPTDAYKWTSANPEVCEEDLTIQKIGRIGIAHMQGMRSTMEDRHIATHITISTKEKSHTIPIYGIFDGHGGVDCARYLEHHLSSYLQSQLETAFSKTSSLEEEETAIFNILKLAFVHLGAKYRKFHYGVGGATANIAIIFRNHLWISNVGDSRAILFANGSVIALSEDAKPALEKYRKGVELRESVVLEIDGIARVGGHLATARAVGHKETTSGINPRAKVIKYSLADLKEGKNFLIIACDGLWDVASSTQVGETVRSITHLPPEEIASHLARKAFLAGSNDNLSILVVPLSFQTQ